MLISLREYAELHGKKPTSVYLKYSRGYFKTARKYGGQVLIDDGEPLVVYRVQKGERFVNPNYVIVREHRRIRCHG